MAKYHYVWLESHREYDENWLAQALSAGFDIHHVDGDHDNNDPANLIMVEKSDHQKLHGNHALFCHKDRNNWDDHNKRVKMGEQAYRLRESGMPWASVGKQLGYRELRATACALSVAKAYANYHEKEWPIPHVSSCTCPKCKAKRKTIA